MIVAVFAVQAGDATLVEDSLHTSSDVNAAYATVEGTGTFMGAGFRTRSLYSLDIDISARISLS